MAILILGLVIFLGVHSVRIFADEWRTTQYSRLGEARWKGAYSLVSLLGLGLIIWGYGLARHHPVVVWYPPVAMRHLASLLTLGAFVLLAATYAPANHIRSALHHPMLLGVKLWAVAHLLANGMLADIILFGAFLIWAVFCFRTSRQRDRATGARYAAGTARGTVIAVIAGVLAWVIFAFWLHGPLIGVAPFGA